MTVNIYYLDDEVELLSIFKENFESEEFIITTFSNVDIFIEAVKNNPPDAVIIDYRLPKTNGEKVALQLDPNLPKALLTGELEVTNNKMFQAVFGKPMSFESVRIFLDSFLK